MNLWWRLVRFGFHLLYNQLAFAYDWVSYVVSLGEWRQWQYAVLPLLTPTMTHILELAHGTGHLQVRLQDGTRHVVGYDLSPHMGRITQRRLQKLEITPQLVNGFAQALPFSSHQFDAVITTFPTNFIFDDHTLAEVHRVLVDNGVLIIVLNGVLVGSGVVRQIIDGLYRITGQTNNTPLNVDALFNVHGFIVTYADVPCPRSIAQVLVAIKTKLP